MTEKSTTYAWTILIATLSVIAITAFMKTRLESEYKNDGIDIAIRSVEQSAIYGKIDLNTAKLCISAIEN